MKKIIIALVTIFTLMSFQQAGAQKVKQQKTITTPKGKVIVHTTRSKKKPFIIHKEKQLDGTEEIRVELMGRSGTKEKVQGTGRKAQDRFKTQETRKVE